MQDTNKNQNTNITIKNYALMKNVPTRAEKVNTRGARRFLAGVGTNKSQLIMMVPN